MDLIQAYWPYAAIAAGVLWMLWGNRAKLLALWPSREPDVETEIEEAVVAAFIAARQVLFHLKAEGCDTAVAAMEAVVLPAIAAGVDSKVTFSATPTFIATGDVNWRSSDPDARVEGGGYQPKASGPPPTRYTPSPSDPEATP